MSIEPNASIEDVIRKAITQTVQFESCEEVKQGSFRPPMDLKDSPLEYVAYIDLPGVDEDELQFTWNEHVLCIGGSREFNHDSEDADEFIQIERKFGDFMCCIPLNDTLDVAMATAKYKRGVLKVHVPKRRIQSRRTAQS